MLLLELCLLRLGFSLSPLINNPLGLLVAIFLAALRAVILITGIVGPAYGLITFLIYITGILVIFRYMLRIYPNFQIGGLIMGAALLAPFIFYGAKVRFSSPIRGYGEYLITSLFRGNNGLLFYFAVTVLLIRLVIVSALCFKGGGPLRSR